MRFNLIMFAAAALFMAACGGGGAKGDGPKEVASKFIGHINNMEFDEAKKYSTEGTAGILDMLKGFAGMAEKPETTGFEILDVKEDGDKATVTYRNEGADSDETLNLVKQDGKWLVDINKEDMNKEDDMGGDDMGASFDFDEALEDLGEEIEEAIEEVVE
jgi:hypothetical protein